MGSKFTLSLFTRILIGLPLFLLLVVQPVYSQRLSLTIQRSFAPQAGPYVISDDLTVPYDEIWEIEPGVRMCFESGVSLRVEGVLLARGTSTLPILLTACNPQMPWRGISLTDSRAIFGTRTVFHHVTIEHARKASSEPRGFQPNTAGGAMTVIRSDLEILHSTLRHNAAHIAGAIYIGSDSDVLIARTAIYDNSALGSNYIFSGGGGLYIAGARRAHIVRNVIARNIFLHNNYSNEEGGGGVYVQSGPVDFAFNLVIANVSGKGAGLLVNAQSPSRPSSRSFVANIFAYNSGSRNFEQVALQTRYSYEKLAGVANTDWTANAGQLPFVAHLNRNVLAEYMFPGVQAFLGFLRPDSQDTLSRHIQDRVGTPFLNPALLTVSPVPLCGDSLDYGPLELCDSEDDVSLSGYLTSLGRVYSTPELAEDLLQHLAPRTSGPLLPGDHARLSALLTPALTGSSSQDQIPRLPAWLVDLVFGGLPEREASLAALAIPNDEWNAAIRGPLPPLLITYALGLDSAFEQLVDTIAPTVDVVRSSLQLGFHHVAFDLLNNHRYRLSRRDLYDLLNSASRLGAVPVVKELLERDVDPERPWRDQLPLAGAVANGHVALTQLLLRYGADPTATYMRSDGPASVLGASLQWLHLGSGRREIAELLIAAGADPSAVPLPSRILDDDIRRRAAATIGFDTPGNQQTRTTPTVIAIQRLGNEPPQSLAAIRADPNAPRADRIAATRLLSVRPFRIDGELRRELVDALDGNDDPTLASELDLEKIMRFYALRTSPVRDALPRGQPAEEQSGLMRGERVRLPYGRKFAIVIGVSDYANLPSPEDTSIFGQDVDLRYGARDAQEIAALLNSGRMGADWEVQTLIGTDASLTAVRDVMTVLREEVTEDDLVVFFFSGHGFPTLTPQGGTYLFVQDSVRNDLGGTALSLAAVRDWVLALNSRHVLLLLDSCRSGGIGAAKGIPSQADYDELNDLRARDAAGKIALTSSMGNSNSYEWPDAKLGLFTAVLLDIVYERGEKFRYGRFLFVRDLYDKLTQEVKLRSSSIRGMETQYAHYVLLDGGDLLDFPIAVSVPD